MRRGLPVWALLTLIVASCDNAPPPSQPSSDESFPFLTLAIGPEIREVPFAEVKCREHDGVRTVELLAPHELPDAQGVPYTPHVLVAKLKGEELLEAHAFGANIHFAGHDYPLIQAIAKQLPDQPAPECRTQVGEQIEITCNETTVVPWLAPGPRPHPSFKVSFRCG